MTATELAVIESLLQAPVEAPARTPKFLEWQRVWKQLAPSWETPIDRALAGGFAADRPAWAFAAGYQAAIQSLVPTLDPGRIAAICITEKDGPHPARIRSRLTASSNPENPWRLNGTKTFVSGADGAEVLFVAASTGVTPEGRNRLRMVMVPADLAGIVVTPLPALGFVPEMPHGKVCFAAVGLGDEAILPGDGYTRAIKPFRTLEDLHVSGAFLAWFFAIGRRFGWPAAVQETLLSLMVAVRALALASPVEPYVHLALGGLLAQVRHLTETIDPLWMRVDPLIRQWWQRDRRILDVAASLRRHRLDAARAYFHPS
jgi:hypothetical protein